MVDRLVRRGRVSPSSMMLLGASLAGEVAGEEHQQTCVTDQRIIKG